MKIFMKMKLQKGWYKYMKYNVGDVVTLSDKRGYNIEDYGKVIMTGIDRCNGKDKYLVDCYSNDTNGSEYIAFYDEEIAGVKQ